MNTTQKNLVLSAEALAITAFSIKKALREDSSTKDKVVAGVGVIGTGSALGQLVGVIPTKENEYLPARFEDYYSVVRLTSVVVNVVGIVRGEESVKQVRTALAAVRITAATYIAVTGIIKARAGFLDEVATADEDASSVA